MIIGGRELTRAEVLRRVGNVAQLGGTRHYTLVEGRSKAVAAIDVRTGGGLSFTLLPDRGLDISRASFKGINLAYLTPNGEVHPAYYEPEGLGWLRTFFAGLLTTCGPTYLGAPGRDGDEDLGLHGRYSTTPARQVCDRSGWDGDEYRVEISGLIEESVLFGDKIRIRRTISTRLGSKSLTICDVAENFGYRTSPFTILYHVNPGFPLLDSASELVLEALRSDPYDERSAAAADRMFSFSEPVPGFAEENFQHTVCADEAGQARVALVNRHLAGGLGLYLKFDAKQLPYLNQWKMMGEGEYAVGLEPCNSPCLNRSVVREKGLLPHLEPGETRTLGVEIGLLEGEGEIDEFVRRLRAGKSPS
jgi:hypothetical protein